MVSGITPKQKAFISATIKKYFPRAKILFFGSRFTGKHKTHSDLDLCIRAEQALTVLEW